MNIFMMIKNKNAILCGLMLQFINYTMYGSFITEKQLHEDPLYQALSNRNFQNALESVDEETVKNRTYRIERRLQLGGSFFDEKIYNPFHFAIEKIIPHPLNPEYKKNNPLSEIHKNLLGAMLLSGVNINAPFKVPCDSKETRLILYYWNYRPIRKWLLDNNAQTSNINDLLFQDLDIETFDTIISLYPTININYTNEFNVSPLYQAIGKKNFAIIKKLLESRATPHTMNGQYPPTTCLFNAVNQDPTTSDSETIVEQLNNIMNIIKILLEHGADPNQPITTDQNSNLLAFALNRDQTYVYDDYKKKIILLLQHEAQLNEYSTKCLSFKKRQKLEEFIKKAQEEKNQEELKLQIEKDRKAQSKLLAEQQKQDKLREKFLNALDNLDQSLSEKNRIRAQRIDILIATTIAIASLVAISSGYFYTLRVDQKIESILKKILAENEPLVADYKNGDEQAFDILLEKAIIAAEKKTERTQIKKLLKKLLDQDYFFS